MSQLAKSIIGKIKKKQIKPTPKWVFLFKRSVVWSLFGLSVLFGSMAISIILFEMRDMDYAVYKEMGSSLTGFVLLALPYFWLVLLAGFLALACYHFRHTKSGYHHNMFAIVVLSLVISIIFGTGLYATGISENLENSLMLVTALNTHIGYEKAAKIAKKAYNDNTSLRKAALELEYLTDEEFTKWVDPSKMIGSLD